MAATRLILSVILLILVCIPPLTSLRYLFSAPLFIMSVTSLLSLIAVRYVALRGKMLSIPPHPLPHPPAPAPGVHLAVHGPLWGAGVGRFHNEEIEPLAGLVSEGHDDQVDPRIPHGLRGGGEPPCLA